MNNNNYRVVRYFNKFLNHWSVRLEKQVKCRLLWWEWDIWQEVCDHVFDDSEPTGWSDFNIVERITDHNL